MARFIRTRTALAEVVPRLSAAEELAVDTEFHTERRYRPELMLVQLRADQDEPILVDAQEIDSLDLLGPALATAPVVVHGGQVDVQLLARATGAVPNVVFDTQIAAACAGDGYPTRLQELVTRHLGLSLDKTWTLSDWSRRPLSPHQLEYAAEDVLVLGDLRARITSRLRERGNEAVARHCADETLRAALAEDDDAEAWRTVNAAHLLDGAETAVLQALAAWRQREARTRDQPRHNVLSDAMLLDLARRRPTSIDSLRANRRLPSVVWKRDGDAIVSIIRATEGRAVEPLHPWPRGWADQLWGAARSVESHTGVCAELLLPDRVLGRLSRGEPVEDWRMNTLGTWFFEFLRGDAPLYLAKRF